MAVQTIIKKRRDTAANWASINPVLSAGEEGYETDSRKSKIGNGTTTWNSLSYVRALTAPDYETTVASAGTKVLTALSARNQFFTGTAGGQNVLLPDTSTLTIGDEFRIVTVGISNLSIRTSTSLSVNSLHAFYQAIRYVCTSTSSNAASSWSYFWEGSSTSTGSGSMVFSSSPVITTPSLTLSSTTSVTSGRLAYTGSTLKLGNGTTTVTFSDDSVNATAYAAASHTHAIGDLTSFSVSTPANKQVLQYDSVTSLWKNATISAGVAVSETAPSSPAAGDLWFNSATAKTYIYYDFTWVELSPAVQGATGPAGPTGPQGPTANIDDFTIIQIMGAY